MEQQKTKKSFFRNPAVLTLAAAVIILGLLFSLTVYPEWIYLNVGLGVALAYIFFELAVANKKALTGRTAAYGLNSFVTVLLVIGIVGVANFLASRYPYKIDTTKNKLHTLSDQTVKLVKGLTKPVKAVLYSKSQEREKFRPLLDNYKGLNPKFEVEFVDPDKEPTRTKSAGIKKYGTLQIIYAAKENKIEDPNEEKLTNSLIKILKDKSSQFCAIIGHGEKSFGSSESEGLSEVKKALGNQSYEVKDINLSQDGKIPPDCDGIALLGPTKPFLDSEAKLVSEYLINGGRAIISLDTNFKGGEYAPQLVPVLEAWYVKPIFSIIIDPLASMFVGDAASPIIATYENGHAITRDFHVNSIFPFTRPLEVISGAPSGTTVQWIAKTTPNSWGVMDLTTLTQQRGLSVKENDKKGPLIVAIAVEGKHKDSKGTKNTRLTVFGTSFFATNRLAKSAPGNLDLFLNSASWVLEDESLISIRAKEEGVGRIELTQKSGRFIFLLTVVIIPILIAGAGIGIWAIRRKW